MKTELVPTVSLKMSPKAQIIKTRSGALGTAANESGSPKHENWTRRPRNRPKRVRERKTLK
jgi:hypothetical protein